MVTLRKMDLLNVTRLPARLDMEQAADLLGFQKHDIPILIRASLIKPLGDPAHNAPKWFSSAIVLELSQDEKWLSKSSSAISRHWKRGKVEKC
jgi:hypothetical protein